MTDVWACLELVRPAFEDSQVLEQETFKAFGASPIVFKFVTEEVEVTVARIRYHRAFEKGKG
jgi:hypothetical protein